MSTSNPPVLDRSGSFLLERLLLGSTESCSALLEWLDLGLSASNPPVLDRSGVCLLVEPVVEVVGLLRYSPVLWLSGMGGKARLSSFSVLLGPPPPPPIKLAICRKGFIWDGGMEFHKGGRIQGVDNRPK